MAKWAAAPKVDMDRRQVSRIERELIERDFIAKTCSNHSRYHGVRTKGIIKYAFDINFAPLINRFKEIQAAAKLIKIGITKRIPFRNILNGLGQKVGGK